MAKEKRSFFDRLTGAVQIDDDENDQMADARHVAVQMKGKSGGISANKQTASSMSTEWEEEPDGQLTVDVHQTPADIFIQTMVAGVKPDDLDISITRDMVTIKGKREATREISDEDYFFRELYWGTFSRTILLPQEIEVEEAEANEKYGLLTIRLPKVDKGRQTKLKVKSNS
jgi:HSP20 family protein